MSKTKTAFVCTDCGSEYARWLGQCTDCKAWNTISEFRQAKVSTRNDNRSGFAGMANTHEAKVQTLDAIDLTDLPRFSSAFAEFDRVLGGGIVPGSAILIGGEPGAGKSTLLLQTMGTLA